MKQIRTWWKGAAAAAVFLLSAMAFSLVSFAQTGTLTVKGNGGIDSDCTV